MLSSCVRKVHDYWHAIKPDGGLPRRRDFMPAAVMECLPYIYIVERKDPGDGGEAEYVFRLIGTQIVEHFGADPTGRKVFDVLSVEAAQFFKGLFRQLLSSPAGGLLYFTYPFGRRKDCLMEFLYLPMLLDKKEGESELILCTVGMLGDEAYVNHMGGHWDSARLTGGGWLDLGFGKPDDTLLKDACAAAGAEYLDS